MDQQCGKTILCSQKTEFYHAYSQKRLDKRGYSDKEVEIKKIEPANEKKGRN